MIDKDRLRKAVEAWTGCVYPGGLPDISPLLDAARLVLDVVAAEGEAEAAEAAWDKAKEEFASPKYDCWLVGEVDRACMQAALTAAALWRQEHGEPIRIEDEIGDLVDRLAAMTPDECRAIDPRAWAQLKIYFPDAAVIPFAQDKDAFRAGAEARPMTSTDKLRDEIAYISTRTGMIGIPLADAIIAGPLAEHFKVFMDNERKVDTMIAELVRERDELQIKFEHRTVVLDATVRERDEMIQFNKGLGEENIELRKFWGKACERGENAKDNLSATRKLLTEAGGMLERFVEQESRWSMDSECARSILARIKEATNDR